MRGKALYIGLLLAISAGILFIVFRLGFDKEPLAPASVEVPAAKERHSNHKLSQSIESPTPSRPVDRATTELKSEATTRSNLEMLGYLLDQGKDDEFLTRVDQLMRLHPQAAEYVAIKADYYYMKQNWTAAEETILKLLDLDPENLFAQSSLGEVQGILGKYDEGIETLNRVLEKDPGNLEALYGTISITDLQGQSEDGVKRILELAAAHPKNGNLAVVSADIYLSQGRYEERAVALKEAMKNDPQNPHPFRLAANDELRAGRFEKAMELGEASLERDNGDDTRRQTHDLIFKAAMGAKDYDRAEKVLARKKQETPWDESIDLSLQAVKLARKGGGT